MLWAGRLFPGERGELGPSEPGPFHVSPPQGGVGQAVGQGGSRPLGSGAGSSSLRFCSPQPPGGSPIANPGFSGHLLFRVCAQEGFEVGLTYLLIKPAPRLLCTRGV